MRWVLAALTVCFGTVVLLGPDWASAQEVEIKAPAPARRPPEPIVIPPGDHGQATRPSDADYYPTPPKVRHEPAFIRPLSAKSPETSGRAGIAGWTAPSTPVGPAQITREVSGWFALGFAFEFGGPPVEKEQRP
ncbi:MAG: hypothetical protein ACREJV_07225 [Candidatus Rokuibacteriota bacterium]